MAILDDVKSDHWPPEAIVELIEENKKLKTIIEKVVLFEKRIREAEYLVCSTGERDYLLADDLLEIIE